MDNAQVQPSTLCKTAAAIITFAGIPAIASIPFIVAYIFTNDIVKAIVYPILGVVLIFIVLSLTAEGLALTAIALALHSMWKKIGIPIALWCQTHRGGGA